MRRCGCCRYRMDRGPEPAVNWPGQAAVLLLDVVDFGAEASEEGGDDFGGVVCAAIVDQQNLPVVEGLRRDALERDRQGFCSIERGDNYADRSHSAYLPTFTEGCSWKFAFPGAPWIRPAVLLFASRHLAIFYTDTGEALADGRDGEGKEIDESTCDRPARRGAGH